MSFTLRSAAKSFTAYFIIHFNNSKDEEGHNCRHCYALYITITAIACDKKGKGNCCEKKGASCSEKTAKINGDKAAFACKLTSKELQQRKAEVLGSLKEQVLEKKELSNGYAYKFKSDDQTIDQLVNFIKAEKQCCSFFSFTRL